MSIQSIRSQLPEYAKDTKLNLGKLVSGDEVEGLSVNQAYGIALASAYATKHTDIINAVTDQVSDTLSEDEINAAKAAATIMGMNNVYYRFVHLASDKDYGKMPAGLRMNVIGKPGIDKVDFELYSLAVSAINGCGMCIDAHVHEVVKGGVSKQGVQSSIRIASVLAAAAQALIIESSQVSNNAAQVA
ncbi:MAG: carboxymuconolactone decarboxylase family protein [Rickettsiales bacterium]|nr:carboxymuconolactone decarboxylase family protein [Rickettsiales bacterium]